MRRLLAWLVGLCALAVALVAALVLLWWPRQYEKALREGNVEEARAALDKLAHFGRDDPDQRTLLAVGFAQAGDLDQTAAQLERSLAIRETASTWDALGAIRFQRGDWDGVVAAHEGSRANGGGQFLISHTAQAWLQLGEPEKAFQVLDTASREHSDSAQLQGEIAALAVRLGDPAGAVTYYGRVLELAPERHTVANDLAWLLATEPEVLDPGRAVALARRALEGEQADNADYLDTLAVAQAAAGHLEEARQTAERAAERAAATGDAELQHRLEQWLEEHPGSR